MKEQERMQDPDLIFLVLVLLVEIARLKHDIIETDFVPVKLLSMSET